MMMAMGGGVRGGIYGTAPNLNANGNPTLENSNQDIRYETDFRSVYARVSTTGWGATRPPFWAGISGTVRILFEVLGYPLAIFTAQSLSPPRTPRTRSQSVVSLCELGDLRGVKLLAPVKGRATKAVASIPEDSPERLFDLPDSESDSRPSAPGRAGRAGQ